MNRPIGLAAISRPIMLKPQPSRLSRLAQITGVVICACAIGGGVALRWSKQREIDAHISGLEAQVKLLKEQVEEKNVMLRSINRLCLVDVPKKGTKK